MYTKQISVYIENSRGQLAEITKIIATRNIDIRALSLADTTSFGILRLIVDDPIEAQLALSNAGYTVAVTPVIAISIPDTPGALSEVVELLSKNDISIEYMYAFTARNEGFAMSIIRVDDSSKAIKVLSEANVSFYNE